MKIRKDIFQKLKELSKRENIDQKDLTNAIVETMLTEHPHEVGKIITELNNK